MVFLRKLYLYLAFLILCHADQLLLKARDEPVGADFQRLILRLAALEGHAIGGAGVVQHDPVAVLYGAVNFHPASHAILRTLELRIDFFINNRVLYLFHRQQLILAEGNLWLQRDIGSEDDALARAYIDYVDFRSVDCYEPLLLYGLVISNGYGYIAGFIIKYRFRIKAFNYLPRSLTLAKARNVHVVTYLEVSLLHGCGICLVIHRYGELGLVYSCFFHGY